MRLLYAGTLSSWQGVGIALEALQQLRRDLPARLTIVGHGRPKQLKLLREKAWELGVGDAIEVLAPVSQVELAGLHHSHHAVLAPLAPDDRNLVQGCCPIKVIEAMATGTPLIASDMPVVRALARNDVDAPALDVDRAHGAQQVLGDADLPHETAITHVDRPSSSRSSTRGADGARLRRLPRPRR